MSLNIGKPPRDLYMATSLESLQPNIYKKVDNVKDLSAKKCCGHADTVYIAAGEAMRNGDEERAYVLFMMYMEILSIVRRKPEYKKDEKYYNTLIGLKKFDQALSACERLQTTLEKRYQLKKEEEETKKLIEKQEQLEKEKKDVSAFPVAKPIAPSDAAAPRAASKSASDPAAADAEQQRTMTCPALNALIQQESASYLIVDVRPADDFAASQLASRFVVNVPAELVRPGVTAPALEVQLAEPSRQLFARRHTVDRLVLLDWSGRDEPGSPLDTLRDAMVRWDVAAYRARPVTLDGGYQMWLHTYPMLTTNPQARAPAAAARPAVVPLSFEYPSLEEPEPPPPQVDRSVKPAGPPSAALQPDTSQPAAPLDAGDVTQRADELLRRIGSLRVDGGGAPAAPQQPQQLQQPQQPQQPQRLQQPQQPQQPQRLQQPRPQQPQTGGGRPTPPGVPSRALKPQLSDEAAARRRIELGRSRLEAERDWQAVRQSRQQQLESEMRAQLQQKEESLLAEIQRLERDQDSWESQQSELRAENDALRLRLAVYEPAAALASPADAAEKLDTERRLQDLQAEQTRIAEQLEQARKRREEEQRAERQRLEKERHEEEVRKRRLEEEARKRRLEEEEARKKRLEEEARKKKEAEAAEERQRRAAEEQRLLEEQERRLQEQDRQQDQVYRARLKDGGGGGGGLTRSHSSPFIARLGEEQAAAPAPHFSRDTKPFSRGRGDVQAARTRRFARVYGSVGCGLTGLKNLGNTCYMNAVVQCINNTPRVSNFFVEEQYRRFINEANELSRGEVAQEMAAAVKELWNGHNRSVALYDLKDVMGRHHQRFSGTAQQDAHEFLMYLLLFLHEDLNEVPKKKPLKEQENDGVPDQEAAETAWEDFKGNNRSFIQKMFWGQHKSTVRCSRCGKESVKFETFSHLSVPMPPRSGKCSLRDCIRLYMAGDTISGWRCPNCKSNIEATKTLAIWRLPPILIIHIQRFYNDGLWRKKQSNVIFPLENLDMSPYLINQNARYRNEKYNLYGVVNHTGSLESGHYTSVCRGPTSGRWSKFDDHEVYPNISPSSVQTSAGYMLFYTRIDGKV